LASEAQCLFYTLPYRTWSPSGAIATDSLTIRTYDTEAPASCGGGDRHAGSEDWLLNDWHKTYGIAYTYDLAGRRISLAHPNALDPCSGSCVQLYKYNATTGTLDTLVHPSASGGTLTTFFTHDNQAG
jgi:hypothetical protein